MAKQRLQRRESNLRSGQECGWGLNCGSGQEMDKFSKLTSKKTKNKKQSKAKTKRLSPSDTQTGQSQIRHNNRLQFQISCFAGFIRGCSNAKGGIEVKLTNVRRCSQMFFTLVVVNNQKKRDKRTNNDLQNITQKTNNRATCICISERKRSSILL